jgi:hypothetical protein
VKKTIPLRELLSLIATILEAPRDRLGRLDYGGASEGQYNRIRDAKEKIRELSVDNCVTPSRDTLEQIAKVIRVHTGEI